MDHRATTLEADKIHQNRLPSVTDDEEEQDAAFTIVRVLDKVATIVDSVQASQKRIEERHREMEDAIKTIQIDILKLAQAHGNTGYTVNKLLEKTRKVSARVKEVRARVEKQSANVQKVEAKQEEMLRKNKFRVVIYQEDIPCPSSLSVVKDRTRGGSLEDAFCPPDDLSSDEEYFIEESKASRFKKSGMRRINNIKKAFSRENIQKTRQNFGKKVDRLRTRIVTPERRERIRQSGERLRQTGIRFKKNISNAAPTKETFKKHKTAKEQTVAEAQEGIQESSVETAGESGDAEPATEEISYTEVITKVKKDKGSGTKGPSQADEKIAITPEKIVLKPEAKVIIPEKIVFKPEPIMLNPAKTVFKPEAKEEEDALLLDLKQSA
ncbi:caveolae-associated protein 4 [Elgaria multicarinata webbii]|uniref:caveolae-associated protein 4 n=1 Tax=Elgaria multicarinata webbii TaxID=159646 RepID=UPI002FCCCCDD